MSLKSSFKSDLEKEQKLTVFLDKYYEKHLVRYEFERISDKNLQIRDIDLIFNRIHSGEEFFVDEKAQLDYINEELPTFAFELFYLKNGDQKKGWFFDGNKSTDFYSLITSIFSDEPGAFTSCKITFVNRKKLIAFLASKKITETMLVSKISEHSQKKNKLEIAELHPKKEGYLYFSSQNKAEKPINLILKLDFLIQNGLAKRFV